MDSLIAVTPEVKALLEKAHLKILEIDKQHRDRARVLSELCNKLLQKRRSSLPKSYDEFLQDVDIVKRATEHMGACQGLNELRLVFWPDEPKT